MGGGLIGSLRFHGVPPYRFGRTEDGKQGGITILRRPATWNEAVPRQVAKHDRREGRVVPRQSLGRLGSPYPPGPGTPGGPYLAHGCERGSMAGPVPVMAQGGPSPHDVPGRPAPLPPCLPGWAPYLHGLHALANSGRPGATHRPPMVLQARAAARGASWRSGSPGTVEDVETRYPNRGFGLGPQIDPCRWETRVGNSPAGQHWRERDEVTFHKAAACGCPECVPMCGWCQPIVQAPICLYMYEYA